MDKEKITYTCTGSVRGSCGIRHRALRAAAACCRDDMRWCQRQGGYSDRAPLRSDGEPLTEEEFYNYQYERDNR
jgi:hypothetical protein